MGNSSISTCDLSVFIVEPSGMQARIVGKHLTELGISQINAYRDGRLALEAMHSIRPDLVISAMYLDDMSGAALIEQMHSDPVLAGCAFILISSEDNPEHLDIVKQSGACAIVQKPFELKDLRSAIYATLDYLNSGSLALESDQTDIENLHVLIVDDSVSARNYLKRVLRNIGFAHFSEAENGADGLDMLDRNSFDLIISDYNMPQMDGGQMVAALRNGSWQNQLPVIMITSEQDEQKLAEVRRAGVTAILDKPFEPAALKGLIERVLPAER